MSHGTRAPHHAKTGREGDPAGPAGVREVAAVFGSKQAEPDPVWERDFALALRDKNSRTDLLALFARFRFGEGAFDVMVRRVILRALCKSVGHDLRVEPGVLLKHPETMEFGDSVFLGANCIIQGRFDGTCKIGNHVWIGPHAYFDARNLVLEDYVGWGPGAKLLGSTHTGEPVQNPIITTPLLIKPVVIGVGADVGTGAVILPGVRIGENAIIAAGAVVSEDVPDYAVAAGVPARVLRDRRDK